MTPLLIKDLFIRLFSCCLQLLFYFPAEKRGMTTTTQVPHFTLAYIEGVDGRTVTLQLVRLAWRRWGACLWALHLSWFFYLVLGDLLKSSFGLYLNDGTGSCSALAVGIELNSFTPPFRWKGKWQTNAILDSGFLPPLRSALSSLLGIFYSKVYC